MAITRGALGYNQTLDVTSAVLLWDSTEDPRQVLSWSVSASGGDVVFTLEGPNIARYVTAGSTKEIIDQSRSGTRLFAQGPAAAAVSWEIEAV